MSHLAYCRGAAQCGELAYGENGKKSSANPEECQSLKGVHTQQVLLSFLLLTVYVLAVHPIFHV